MSEESKKLVVWSGGMDSTLLLHTQAKGSSKENPIEAFSFEPDFIDENKLVKERQARKNYLQYAKSQGFHISDHIITLKADINPGYGWSQQKSWFTFILPYVPNDCDVYFGYVQGDCVWLAVSHFYKIFGKYKYLGSFQNSKLHFPFAFKEKWEVLKDYQEEGIPKNCSWTCEHPIKRDKEIIPCGKCHPCITLKMAKKELKYRKDSRCLK